MNALLTVCAIAILSVAAFAQEAMTNQDVVAMVNAGLSPEIVNAKIRSSKTNFDTSTDALLKLSQAKVPDAVVVAMVEKQQKESEKSEASADANQKSRDSVPEQGNLNDLVGKKRVFVSTNYLKGRDIITKEITKEGTFTVVDRVEDSDFAIIYGEETRVVNVTATANRNGNTTNASARENTEQVGTMRVMMRSTTPGADRVRMLYETTKTKYWVWDDPASKSTTKQFLKDFKKIQPSNP